MINLVCERINELKKQLNFFIQKRLNIFYVYRIILLSTSVSTGIPTKPYFGLYRNFARSNQNNKMVNLTKAKHCRHGISLDKNSGHVNIRDFRPMKTLHFPGLKLCLH